MSKKKLYECPSCRAVVSIRDDLEFCPVCQERLDVKDEARYLIFTEQELFGIRSEPGGDDGRAERN